MSPPKKQWPLSRKMTIILGSVILAIIIIAVLVVAFVSRQNNTASNQDQSLYYDRPGYDRAKLGTGTADPFAVTFSANNQPTEYQGNKVIQACNVLQMNDITKQDILIKANTLPTVISRTYNDGTGKGTYASNLFGSSLSTLGLGMDINSCNYVLEDSEDAPTIGVNVFQPFTVPSNVVDEEVQQNYAPVSPLEGLGVYRKKAGGSSLASENKTEYILRQQQGSGFYIAIELPSDKATKEQAILESAAKNFTRELSSPSGPQTVGYDSPTFTKSFTPACSLLTNNDIRSLSGQDASPLAREGIASSVAILSLNDSSGQVSYPNIRSECARATTAANSGLSLGSTSFQVMVETTSYLSDVPAKKWVEAQKKTNPNNRDNVELSEQVGDGGIAYTDISGDPHVIFSKGRIVVDMSVNKNAMAQAGIRDLSSAATKLTPIAQSMSDRTKE